MPESLLLQVLLYILCFVVVWFGANLVVSSVSDLAKTWRLPAFIVSFFLLGVMTSLPEITIGTISVRQGDAEIMVGNLLGGVIVMFLGIIPLLAIVGNGVKIPNQLGKAQLIHMLIVVTAPAFLVGDQRLSQWEAVFLVLLYASLILFFSFKQSFFEKMKTALAKKKKKMSTMILKILLGVALLIGSGHYIVSLTSHFADLLGISPFFVGLIVVAIGTNVPELSIVFNSVIHGKKDIALADYLGSASVNTLLLGIFTLMYGKTIFLPNHFLQRFLFLVVGSVLLFFFIRSGNKLSRVEGFVLLSIYIGFILFEVVFSTNLV